MTRDRDAWDPPPSLARIIARDIGTAAFWLALTTLALIGILALLLLGGVRRLP